MLVGVTGRSLAKAGNRDGEYEDALLPADGLHESRVFRCAVADGATETSYSGLWARLLVEAYVGNRLGSHLGGLASLSLRWQSEAGTAVRSWYAEEKLRQGAFAALVGLALSTHGSECRWHALAAGDACLFQLRGEILLTAFPLNSPAAFSNRPALLSTVAGRNAKVPLQRWSGRALSGDRFLLMTDALACWFLKEIERGDCPRREVHAALEGDFAARIDVLRSTGELRNDDVTLLAVDVG
ncbi:MAG: protein phosphatase 2C domain-containing protein [Dehalococcoidia bacterium]